MPHCLEEERTFTITFAVLLCAAVVAGLAAGCAPVVRVVEVEVTAAPQVNFIEVTATPVPISTDVTVCASGCEFTTIQAAVDDPGTTGGGTVLVLDAVHTEGEITVHKDVTIRGQGADRTIVQAHEDAGSARDRVFFVTEGAAVTVRDMTIRHGNPDLEPLIPGLRRGGGGIANRGVLALVNSVVRDNIASEGGGIYNAGVLTVTNCTISGNFADGVDEKTGQGCGSGGGIKHQGEGAAVIRNSTISDNRATNKGGGVKGSCAGAMEFTNSTISGNHADGNGGGIYAMGVVDLVNCTISDNGADGQGNGVYVRGTLNYTNTIVDSRKSGVDCFIGVGDRDAGTIGANANNLIGDGTCDSDYSGDPLLGGLGDGGGPLMGPGPMGQTHPLLSGSPAIDAIPADQCVVANDQRGVPRPQGAGCDIGAFELEAD